jgi:tight adherence protein C
MLGTPLLVSLLAAAAIGALVAGIYRLRASQDSLQQRMEDFVQWSPPTLEAIELQQPFVDRVVRPLLRGASALGARVLPQRSLDQTRRELLQAGSPGRLAAIDFLGLRLIVAVVLGGLSLLFTAARGLPILQLVVGGVVLTVVGSFLPRFWLQRLIKTRQHEISRALSDALDMLTICVDAGLAFELAMVKISEKWDNALAQEFSHVVGEVRMGVPRQDALRRMSDRTGVAEVGNFVAVLVQAHNLGISIAQVLHVQSDQMRTRRRQRAEELANQAPIKMVFPLVFLILPALFAVILGPAIPSFLEAFGAMGVK